MLIVIVSVCNNQTHITGQTLKNVGVWMRSGVFTHGQLYVACSRVGSPEGLKFALMKDSAGGITVKNVVYHEVLLNHET